MCRTTLTVIHHACIPGHLTHHTTTQQCYDAYRVGASICALDPPAHRTFEYHFPGGACQECCEAADAEAINDRAAAMAAPAVNSHREVEAPPYPPPTFPYHQPTLWNRGPFPHHFVAPALVPPPRPPLPPLPPLPLAQPARRNQRRGMPGIREVDSDNHANEYSEPADRSTAHQYPPRLRQRSNTLTGGNSRPPSPTGPLQATLRGGMTPPSDTSSTGSTADEDERALREGLQRSRNEYAARQESESSLAAEQSLWTLADAEEAAVELAMQESVIEGEQARLRWEVDYQREVARLLEESAREYWQGIVRLQGKERLGEEEEREVLRRSVQTWQDDVGEDWETFYTIRYRFACGHEVITGVMRVREGDELPEEHLEEVPGGCWNCEKAEASLKRGAAVSDGNGTGYNSPGTASYAAGTRMPKSTGYAVQEKPYQGKGKQRADSDYNPPPPPSTPTLTSRPRPSEPPTRHNTYPPHPTVEDDTESTSLQPSETWPSEMVAPLCENDDVSTIMDPAAEVARAMDAVQLSRNPVEDVREARLARFGARKAWDEESEV